MHQWALTLSELSGEAHKTAATVRMVMSRALAFMADPDLAACVLPAPGTGFDIGDFLYHCGTVYLIAEAVSEDAPVAPLFAAMASEIHYTAAQTRPDEGDDQARFADMLPGEADHHGRPCVDQREALAHDRFERRILDDHDQVDIGVNVRVSPRQRSGDSNTSYARILLDAREHIRHEPALKLRGVHHDPSGVSPRQASIIWSPGRRGPNGVGQPFRL